MGSEGTTRGLVEQDACSVAILTWRRPDRARNLVSGAPGLLLVWVQRSDDDKEPTHE